MDTNKEPGSPKSEKEHAAGRVHEWRALPGDVHVPLIARAVREKVLHQPGSPRSPSPVVGEPGRPGSPLAPGPGSPTTKLPSAFTESVKHRMAEAVGAATGRLAEVLHTVEHSALTAKEKLDRDDQRWQQETAPHEIEEQRLARGEIPSSTEEVMAAKLAPAPEQKA